MKVGAEKANPEKCCLLGDGRQSLFDDIGGLVFTLRWMSAPILPPMKTCRDLISRQSEAQMCR
jgi:hypothetical protein